MLGAGKQKWKLSRARKGERRAREGSGVFTSETLLLCLRSLRASREYNSSFPYAFERLPLTFLKSTLESYIYFLAS